LMRTNTGDQRRRRVGEQDVGEDLVGSGGADEGHGIGFPVGETERVSLDVRELSQWQTKEYR
jgi:hypothetical protein